MMNLRPMEAAKALYSNNHHELSEEIVASLSHAIFSGCDIKPAGKVQRILARVSYRILQWTTTSSQGRDESGTKVTVFRNPLMERTGHPYARLLLASSRSETAALIEGGDPMN